MSEELNQEQATAAVNAEAAEEEAAAAENAAAAAAEPEDEDEEFDVNDYLRQYQDLEKECAAAKEALSAAEARLLRLQADFDNYRRRQREAEEDGKKQAAASLASSILPVLDNFERALAAMEDTPAKEGVELIAKQLLQVLQAAGLEEIPAQGEEFDPNLHQAVLRAEAGEENLGKVTMVLQRGYLFHGKLLRASMVQVGC